MPPSIEAPGSLVPRKSLNQARTTFMPDAIWDVSRPSPRFLPKNGHYFGFDAINSGSRHVVGGSLSFAFLALT